MVSPYSQNHGRVYYHATMRAPDTTQNDPLESTSIETYTGDSSMYDFQDAEHDLKLADDQILYS